MVADLPAQFTAFVGRTQELAEITALLDDLDCRLVTLVGQGGSGKTRMSLEVGTLLRQRGEASKSLAVSTAFAPCNVYFVPLQPLNSPEFILSTVAEAVGLQFYAGSDPQEQLIDYLRPEPSLLIFDNFEHLLDSVDVVTTLLANAPKLKILVTSRETLNLREEWLYSLNGMAFPAQDDVVDAGSYSAVQLFVQSAHRVRPDFTLSTEQQSVLRICRLVEGMPLALEITAAWLRRLPTDEIARQIERGLDILESPARNAPPRHRSIRAVFENSWNLLTETEQDVFKKLSVFRGGFRREAAELIAGASLVVLSALVDKSLLSVNADGRYYLHELVRQYADEKLNVTPDTNQRAHEDHARYFLDFLTKRYVDMMVHMTRVVVAEIMAELKNIHPALGWLLEHEDIEAYDDALYCLTLFCQFRCLYEEGEEVTKRIVAALRRKPQGELLGRMLIMQGWFAELRSQDYARAITILEEGSRIGLTIGDANYMEGALRLSDIAVQQGNYEEARKFAQECVDFARTESVSWKHTFDMAHLGHVLYLMGEYDEAKKLTLEAINIAATNDVASGLSDARNNLGLVELALQNYQAAKDIFAENLAYSQQVAYPKGTVLALISAGEAAEALEEYPEARQRLSEALKIATESNQIPYLLNALRVTAALLARTGNGERAAEIVLLILDHRAATHETKRQASQLLSQLESELAPETLAAAVDRARISQIEKVVKALVECELSEDPNALPPSFAATSGALTEREIEILRLTAEGLSNRKIAEQLFLAVGTVKWYLSEIYGKLYVTSRTQAIARARELNVLS